MRTRNKAPVSPLRYPGAKRWMSNYIRLSILQNPIHPELFVEPFAGGASVSLSVLYEGLVDRIGLVDRDPLIAAFWKTLFFDTEWLIEQVINTDVTLEIWDQLKQKRPQSIREKAFACLFFNRTNFSGILKSDAGPIGGRAQTSPYKIDCRFPKDTLVKRILKIAKYRQRVAFVWNLPWKSALSKVNKMQEHGSLSSPALFYFDPPFYKKADKLYNYYFNHAEHLHLRDYLCNFSQSWILSYDSCSEIIEMYLEAGFHANDVNLIYKAQRHGRGIGKEVIVSNLPNMVSELQLGSDKSISDPKVLCRKLLPAKLKNKEKIDSYPAEKRAL
ncbi:MAG: DNA adenine methylase [Cyanobacteria bacterium J06560_6]